MFLRSTFQLSYTLPISAGYLSAPLLSHFLEISVEFLLIARALGLLGTTLPHLNSSTKTALQRWAISRRVIVTDGDYWCEIMAPAAIICIGEMDHLVGPSQRVGASSSLSCSALCVVAVARGTYLAVLHRDTMIGRTVGSLFFQDLDFIYFQTR